jgi:hypothetical protein
VGSQALSPIGTVFRFIIYSRYSRLFNFHPWEEGGEGKVGGGGGGGGGETKYIK